MSTSTQQPPCERFSSGCVADYWLFENADGNVPPEASGEIIIAGLGNLLLGDDGVGVHAVRNIQYGGHAAGALVMEIGTAVLAAVYTLERAREIILVDAVQAGGSPGSVYLFRSDQVAPGPDSNGRGVSMHQLGIVNALRLFTPDSSPRIHVVGVEPADISYGTELSPEVKAALPTVVVAVNGLVRRIMTAANVSDS